MRTKTERNNISAKIFTRNKCGRVEVFKRIIFFCFQLNIFLIKISFFIIYFIYFIQLQIFEIGSFNPKDKISENKEFIIVKNFLKLWFLEKLFFKRSIHLNHTPISGQKPHLIFHFCFFQLESKSCRFKNCLWKIQIKNLLFWVDFEIFQIERDSLPSW